MRPQIFPSAEMEQSYVYVCIDVGMIRFIGEALNVLIRRSAWKTENDFLAARQKLLETKAALMAGCDTQLIRDLSVLMAKAHRLDYTEALEASMPSLAAALYNAEQSDTTGAMDAIYRHGAGEQSLEQSSNDNTCALIGWLAMLLSDGVLSPAVASTACTVLKSGGQAALDLLGEANERGVGNNATLALRGSGDDPPTNLLDAVDELEAMLGYEGTT
jgi:hypothetical protein